MKKNRLFFLAPTEYTLVYKTHSALEFPKGIPLHLHYRLGFIRVVARQQKLLCLIPPASFTMLSATSPPRSNLPAGR